MYDEPAICDECGRSYAPGTGEGYCCPTCISEYERAKSGDISFLENDPDSAFYNPFAGQGW